MLKNVSTQFITLYVESNCNEVKTTSNFLGLLVQWEIRMTCKHEVNEHGLFPKENILHISQSKEKTVNKILIH